MLVLVVGGERLRVPIGRRAFCRGLGLARG